MSSNQDKMPFWKTGFSQVQVTALSACTFMKFNDIGDRGDWTI